MTFPNRDTFQLMAEGCTFFIEREEGSSLWLLSYRTRAGNYHYRRCSTAEDCAALLAEAHRDDQEWIDLHQRIPDLVLPPHASDLTTWLGVSDASPR